MKNKIILILILISSQLYSETNEDYKRKQWTLTFNRNSTHLYPYEKYAFKDVFAGYRNKSDETVNNYEFTFKKRFENSNFAVYADFFEFNKRAFSQKVSFFENGQLTTSQPISIGDYFRTQFRTGLSYSLSNEFNFSLIFGPRYIKSELTDTYALSYSVKFAQKYIGPEIGLEYQTDKYANFFFAARLSFFQLYGRIYNNYGFQASNTDQGYILVDIKPYTKYIGREVYFKTGYFFTENIFISIGLKTIAAKIIPDDMRIYSGDSKYDTFQNIQYGLKGDNVKFESFQSVVIELGTNI